MEPRKPYSNHQANSTFQPRLARQTFLDLVNPGRIQLRSSSISNPFVARDARGSAFTNQDAYRFQSETPPHLSDAQSAVQLNPALQAQIREFGATLSQDSTNNLLASNRFPTQSESIRFSGADLLRAAPLAASYGTSSVSEGSSDRNATNLSLASQLIGNAAAGYLMGDTAARFIRPNPRLPDEWVSKQGLQPWSTAWTENGQNQFRATMSEMLDRKIKADPNSPLREFAEQDQQGKWKLKPEYHAGHTGSKTSGTREMFAIEHEDRNLATSSQEKKLKQQGTFLRKRAVSIDGIPIEIQTARNLEEQGKLPKGTVAEARVHPGWARTAPVTSGEVSRIRNRLYSQQLSAELERLRNVENPSSAQQTRLQQLQRIEDQIKKGRVKAPSTNALASPNNRAAIQRLEGMAQRANRTPGGKWRGTRITDRSVDVVRDQLIRSELQDNKTLSRSDIRALQRRLSAGTVTDADLARLNPDHKARIEQLRDIAKHPKKRPGRALYAFYDQTLRESVNHTRNPARGRDVADSRGTGTSTQRRQSSLISRRDRANEANPERRRSINPADRSPRARNLDRPSRTASDSRNAPPVRRDTPSRNVAPVRRDAPGRDRTPRRSPRIEPEIKPPSRILDGARSMARSGGRLAGRAFKPLGIAVDAYEIGSAMYKDGGIGENTKRVAKDAAISWGSAAAGAAAGAAIGSVVPVIGTGAGAIVGGIVGGLAPDAIGWAKGLFS